MSSAQPLGPPAILVVDDDLRVAEEMQRAGRIAWRGLALRAPVAGRVVALHSRQGAQVTARQPLIDIIPEDTCPTNP